MIESNVDTQSDRFSKLLKYWKRLSGGKTIDFDNIMYLSECENTDVNMAITHLLKSKGALPDDIDVENLVEYYIQSCSLQCNSETLSIVAATLANGGICPTTGEKIFSSTSVQRCLSLVSSCGMNNQSGEFQFKVGVPAISGVSGGTMLVVPGLMGVCIYSPTINEHCNSVRGAKFCELLSSAFNLHQFHIRGQICIPEQNKLQLGLSR
mmetsp:Transcript_17928/g.30495  ORF Transcript_17928/g.30495 Transcript_17928/m.30495 type:complete len:209 (-) Transcript_17928:566-1192(-)